MKRIINGKMYNTETAKKVTYADHRNGNFNEFEESLYKKRTGEFFIHGEGGPTSAYGHSQGNCLYSGEKIIPMTETEVKAWLERNELTDEYIELFGEPEE